MHLSYYCQDKFNIHGIIASPRYCVHTNHTCAYFEVFSHIFIVKLNTSPLCGGCACTDQLEHGICGYLSIPGGDEVCTIIVCFLCLLLLEAATSVLHLCPWTLSNVRRLLYWM